MDLGKFQLFSMLTKRMAWLGKRQQLLAQNIANANTPRYVPQDLAPVDFKRMAKDALGGIQVSTTNPRHLVGTLPRSPEFRVEPQRESFEITPDGNAVVLEEQLMKVSQTVMDYKIMTNLYRKHVGMIRTAIGQRG